MHIILSNIRTALVVLMVSVSTASVAQINALFTSPDNQGCSPFITTFIDQSTGNITSWEWIFGNGSTSFPMRTL